MAAIETTDGVLVKDKIADEEISLQAAQASVEDRNKRAKELGIKTRYQMRK